MKTSKTLIGAAICLALALAGIAVAVPPIPATTNLTIVPKPATLSGNTDPDVTFTTTTGTPTWADTPVTAGNMQVQWASDENGDPVPSTYAGTIIWVEFGPPQTPDQNGQTTWLVDLDALFTAGTVVAIRAHFANASSGYKTHDSEVADLEIVADLEGLSHGYWKNHVDDWVGYSTGDMLGDIFDIPASLDLADVTLLAALDFTGGSTVQAKAQILLRNAVASLLNANHLNINYPMTLAEVIAAVNEALATEDGPTMLALEEILDDYNNLGADLDS